MIIHTLCIKAEDGGTDTFPVTTIDISPAGVRVRPDHRPDVVVFYPLWRVMSLTSRTEKE